MVRGIFSPVYINQITHGLEGIKGNAKGQYQFPQGKFSPKQLVDVPHCKVPVFEHGQNTEVYEEDGSCNPLLVSFVTCFHCFFLFRR